MTAAGLAVAALVLFGLVAAGANSAAPAATRTALKTTTIGGMTVLTNARGFTLYSFAPDTPASSKCYGSCAVYWPPVTGTTAAGQGLPGKLTTITRTDGSHQLTSSVRVAACFRRQPGRCQLTAFDTRVRRPRSRSSHPRPFGK